MLYARALLLRNCGRFTHISSDFGSQYHTHMFVTSEALYASLTRGAAWRHAGKFIDLELDAKKTCSEDYFFCDYDLKAIPVWFIPGVFIDPCYELLAKEQGVVDKNDFNVVDEDYPSTGGNGRAHFIPTYGKIEGILPGHQLLTWAFSPEQKELGAFFSNQTFLMGKKRTMFQVMRLSSIIKGKQSKKKCHTPYLQLKPADLEQLEEFQILAVTMRYILLKGQTRDEIDCYGFSLNKNEEFYVEDLFLPRFYLDRIPW